jgi:UDP-N-acetylmuramoylalanine--D-glutamate ligase
VPDEAIREGILTFKGLEHRLEYVGEYRKIHFYNDSIATIPEAAMEAVKSIPNTDTIILGGFDRGIDYKPLADFLSASTVRNIILTGDAGKRIGECFKPLKTKGKKIFYINRFELLRDIVFRETRPGYACLLSPAAASYDEFANFEERGKRFRELIKSGH